MSDSPAGDGARILMILAGLVVVIAGLRAAASLVVPFLLAAMVATLTLPLLRWLRSRGLPRILAGAATILVSLAVLSLFGFLASRQVNEFTEELPRYQAGIQRALTGALEWAQGHGLPFVADDFVDAGSVVDLVGGTIQRVASVLQNALLVILTTIFILLEASYFPSKLRRALGQRADLLQRWTTITRDVQRYLGLKTVVSLATGSLVALWLSLLDIDFPLFWGLVAFLLNFIPNLGSIVASVPTVLLALIQSGTGLALLTALGYLAINIGFGNFLEPTLMGRRFGLSTLVVFMSVIFWGWVWGPVGMLLSVPLTMIFKIALENSPNLRWVAVLLGGPVPPAATEGGAPVSPSS